MYLEEHEKRCREQMGRSHTVAHLFLDQFFRYFDSKYERHNAAYHRHILHHNKGLDLVAALFGENKKEAARLHILDDQLQDGYPSAIPESWEDFPIWGVLGPKIRAEIKTHWEQMNKLHDRFTMVILGDTYGAITKPVKKVLQEASLIIVTGQYWNDSDKQLTKEMALKNLQKYGVVIALQEEPGRWQSIRIRNNRFYFEKSTCASVDSEVKFLIDAPKPEGATLEWKQNFLHIYPGYTGSDNSKVASLIRIDSYGSQWQETKKDLYITCLKLDNHIGKWVYGEFFSPQKLQVGAKNAVRISELPPSEQEGFKSFLKGSQAPILYPDEKENFAYRCDYADFLCKLKREKNET